MEALNALNVNADLDRSQAVLEKYDDDQNGTLELTEFRNMCLELMAEQVRPTLLSWRARVPSPSRRHSYPPTTSNILRPLRARAQGLTVNALRPREVLRRRRARRNAKELQQTSTEATSLNLAVIMSATNWVSRAATRARQNAVTAAPTDATPETGATANAASPPAAAALVASKDEDFESLPLVTNLDAFLASKGKLGLAEQTTEQALLFLDPPPTAPNTAEADDSPVTTQRPGRKKILSSRLGRGLKSPPRERRKSQTPPGSKR